MYVDVGCDHGGLPLTLLAGRPGARVIAVDVNAAPCASARENARRLGLPLDVRQGDGLTVVEGRVDVVSVCGVGSSTVVGVLEGAPGRVGVVVAQPNDSARLLRGWAREHGWVVERERGLYDRGRYFNTLVLVPGLAGPADEVELTWGVAAQVGRAALRERLAREVDRLRGLPGRAAERGVAESAQERLADARGADPA